MFTLDTDTHFVFLDMTGRPQALPCLARLNNCIPDVCRSAAAGMQLVGSLVYTKSLLFESI